MSDIPLEMLFAILAVLLVLSAFFSSSETALMSLNRYRLRHLARSGRRSARLATKLLDRPDRILGVILLGNNFVNILAASLATVIALELYGEGAVGPASLLLTLVVLIFSEVAPKTLAALHPERIAFPAAWPLAVLLRLLYPLVWAVNTVANATLRLFRVDPRGSGEENLSREELRSVVNEAGTLIPRRHQKMLLNILDLEKATVEDIMVPRNEIVGIDVTDDWDEIVTQLATSQHTRLPVFRESIDDVHGILHLRRIIPDLTSQRLTREQLLEHVDPVYFIPEGTRLHTQLVNFQRQHCRVGMVVDEYGDIMGLVALEDILEEIVGEFTTDPAAHSRHLRPLESGGYLAQGSISVRELNRALDWDLPTDGPRTLNGLILEHLQSIPEPGTSLLVHGFPVTIVQTQDNKVKTAEIQPRAVRPRRRRTE
ncbi:HlyC/CorC family transporter [Aquisalimonas lutea]|uniref:HlyC/CorC family transporter n=1 Tax=Aquisalimonas lutea TaxID=1327750 RepID=UPI0025B6129E|nr:HlyC/CorC family transporter [Aquisalimonas lutea]MDN3517358.1 HlyC/CorC family transporter [Aquisalimonas lutea]